MPWLRIQRLMRARRRLLQVAVEHGLAAFFAGFPGEPCADEAAGDGDGGEEPGGFAMRAEDEDENVGAAGDGQRDGGGIE